MAEKETAKDKKVKELIKELERGNEQQQIKAIKALKTHGNETVIEPLLILLASRPVVEIEEEIIDLLNTTKSTKVPAEIARALGDKRFVEIRQILLTTIWNSGLDYRPYLSEIVTVATEGEMMDALECITIIENLDGELTEEQIFEPLLVLTAYMGENSKETGPKMDMLKEVTATLQNRNNLL